MKKYTRNINKWFPERVTLLFPMTDLLVSRVFTVFCMTVIFIRAAGGNQNRGSHDEGKFNQIRVFPQHTKLTMLTSLFYFNFEKTLGTVIKILIQFTLKNLSLHQH